MAHLQNKVYAASEIDFSISDVPSRLEPTKVLMASPEFFEIIDVKNAHMQGHSGSTDKKLALLQWQKIKDIYLQITKENILSDVKTIAAVPSCEDMVFAANQSFPWLIGSEKVVIMSKMKHPSRQREVPYFKSFYESQGYKIIELQETKLFEGMGDTIPHYGKKLLYGGYGHRTEIDAYREVSALLNIPIVPLELIDERFYHLDTCFLPLDENCVMLFPPAFSEEGLATIKKFFSEVIEIPLHEASAGFALNAHLINDQKTAKKIAIIQKGNTFTKNSLQRKNFKVTEVDTSEYIKSGGSVFCMKIMFY